MSEQIKIVGIGASAGGLEALTDFFPLVPSSSGIAYIVLQHHPASIKSLLDEILGHHTSMNVKMIENDLTIEPNTVYVSPVRVEIGIEGDQIVTKEAEISDGSNQAIDNFFRAVAQGVGANATGIILSGSGSDGARGVLAIKQAGGQVYVQSRESALFDGMPASSIATGVADFVGNPAELSKKVAEQVDAVETQGSEEPLEQYSEREHIIELLRTTFGIQFDEYRSSTIDRRIARRMNFCAITDSKEYIRLLSNSHEELNLLYEDLLIGVTRFFRDEESFKFIEEKVIPNLFARANELKKKVVRVWVAGCASGEEAYSYSILLAKYIKENGLEHMSYKIFASDLHPLSLEKAASGEYPEDSLSELSPEILRDYFTRIAAGYKANVEIRSAIVFCKHDVISDPPFTKIDLLSCRNVLIYFNESLQKKVNALFSFSLSLNGYLVLGPTESVSAEDNGYNEISAKWRVFRKIRKGKYDAKALSTVSNAPSIARNEDHKLHAVFSAKEKPLASTYSSLLDYFVESVLLVDEFRNILHVFGNAGSLLQVKPGPAEQVLDRMVDDRLAHSLSAAMFKASKSMEPVSLLDVQQVDGTLKDLVVIPFSVKGQKNLNFFIAVKKSLEAKPGVVMATLGSSEEESRDLQEQLRVTEDRLQASREELETSSEELQSTNEELQNTNEELHSVNAELISVNSQFQDKIVELSTVTSHFDQILEQSGVACLVLNADLELESFSKKAVSLINLIDEDIGRPIGHFSTKLSLDTDELVRFAKAIRNGQANLEKKIKGLDGSSHLIKGSPLMSAEEGQAPGVLVCILDKTALSKAEDVVQTLKASYDSERVFSARTLHSVEVEFQTPVRHLNFLLEKLSSEANLVGASAELLQRIREEADKMQNNLTSLKKLRETITTPFETADVHLEEIFSEVLSLTGLQDQVEVVTNPTTFVHCDKDKIIDVLKNVLLFCDNILDEESEFPQIALDVRGVGSLEEISVTMLNSHNAPSEVFKDDLFLVFSDNMASTNLMLSKSVVEAHGGRIWYDRVPSVGGRFSFTLRRGALADSSNKAVGA